MISQCVVCGRAVAKGDPVVQVVPFTPWVRTHPFGSDADDRVACISHLVDLFEAATS